MFMDKSELTNFINEYINKSILKVDSFKNAEKEYKKLSAFLKKNDIFVDFNLARKLLRNSKLNKVITEYYYRYFDLFNYFKIENMFDDVNLMSFLDAYKEVKSSKNNSENKLYSRVLDSYLESISHFPILTMEQERELAIRIKAGDEKARELLINCNLQFVVNVAKKYMGMGIPLEDLIQEGNVGLINASYEYDYTKGFRFNTYAKSHIVKEILVYINEKLRMIKIPVNVLNKIKEITQKKKEIESSIGHNLSADELAKALNMSIEDVNNYYILIEMQINRSLEYKKDDESSSYKEEIKDSDVLLEDEIIENIFQEELEELIKELFIEAKLKEEEIKLLTIKYGLFASKRMKIGAIANMYNVTKQCVASRENVALEKLILANGIYKLLEFTDNPENNRFKIIELRRKIYERRKRRYCQTHIFSNKNIKILRNLLFTISEQENISLEESKSILKQVLGELQEETLNFEMDILTEDEFVEIVTTSIKLRLINDLKLILNKGNCIK